MAGVRWVGGVRWSGGVRWVGSAKALQQRDGRSYTSLVKLSVQLSHLLLSWSCNARDVHLLRGLPARVVTEAARLHDRSIMVACAAIQGCATLPSRPDSDYTGDPSETVPLSTFLDAGLMEGTTVSPLPTDDEVVAWGKAVLGMD